MRDNYYRTGEGFLLVYSITVEETFKDLKELRQGILRVTESEEVSWASFSHTHLL